MIQVPPLLHVSVAEMLRVVTQEKVVVLEFANAEWLQLVSVVRLLLTVMQTTIFVNVHQL